MKTCTGCGAVKPREHFQKMSKAADGLQHRCKACTSDANRAWYEKNRARRAESQRAWYAANADRHNAAVAANRRANPEHYRALATDNARLKRYGLTADQFAGLLMEQDGACAICRQAFSSEPHVDHCHTTDVVRGLLCGKCNRGLGMFDDVAKRLRAAACYLERAR